jgi:hypothetical protein
LATYKNTASLFLVAIVVFFLATHALAQNNIAVLGISQMTRDSTGYGYGYFQRQTSATAFGPSIEYRYWWRSNGFSASYSAVASNANFITSVGETPAALKRHEFIVAYVHRWNRGNRTPYVKIGGGGFITNGGWFPGALAGERLGIDGQGLLTAEIGVDVKLSSRLSFRSGLAADWFRAPDFSDAAYHAGRTAMLEPKVGFVWSWR